MADATRQGADTATGRRLTRFTASLDGGSHRVENLDGVSYLVVPVVALTEGVIRASNAPCAELVQASVYSQMPSQWDGRPVVCDHPEVDGRPTSANLPAVSHLHIGRVYGAHIANRKLAMEAWIDEARARRLGGQAARLVDRIRANQLIEVSVGAYVEVEPSSGTWRNLDGQVREYDAEWVALASDHLALLPEGIAGACNVENGCGTRAAESALRVNGSVPPHVGAVMSQAPVDVAWSAPTLSDFTSGDWASLGVPERKKIAAHFAWAKEMPPESFGDLKLPHHRPSDGRPVWRGVTNALARLDQTSLPAEDKAAVRRHLEAHRAAFERAASAHKETSMVETDTKVSMWDKLVTAIVGVRTNATAMSDDERREVLFDALRRTEANAVRVVSVTMSGDAAGQLVYLIDPDPGGPTPLRPYARDFSIGDDGRVTFPGDRVAVRPRTEWVPMLAKAAATGATSDNTSDEGKARAAGCGCGKTVTDNRRESREGTMADTKQPHRNAARISALIANEQTPYTEVATPWLESLTDEQLATVEAQVTPKTAKADEKPGEKAGERAAEGAKAEAAKTDAATADTTAAKDEKIMVEIAAEELVDLRAAATAFKAEQAARKAELVAALKGAQKTYDETRLASMPVAQLEEIAALLAAAAGTANVDYAGRSAAAASSLPESAKPLRSYDRALAARKQ